MTTLWIALVFLVVWFGVVLMFAAYESRKRRQFDRGLPPLERQAQMRRRRGR